MSYTTPPATGDLVLSGDAAATVPVADLVAVGPNDYVFMDLEFTADGTAIDLTAAFSDDPNCGLNEPNAGTAPPSCSPDPCSISAITTSNPSACDDQGTSDETDDTFTTNVTVTFAMAPATGELVLSGDGATSVAVGSLDSPTSHTFVGVEMSADGGAIALTAAFSDDPNCTLTDNNAGTALDPCSPAPVCMVSAITTSNNSACDNQGTPNPGDDTFTTDVTVEFSDIPSTGTLDLSGDGSASVAVGALDSPTSHTFVDVVMSADGGDIDLTAAFSDNPSCSQTNNNAGTAPDSCSPCDIVAITVTNISACNDNGTADPSDDYFTSDIQIDYANAPNTGDLVISGDLDISAPANFIAPNTHIFSGFRMSADGTPIELTATFSAEPNCTLTNSNAGMAPDACSAVPECMVTAISTSNTSACDNQGTPNAADDTFTTDVTVEFANAPASGTLDLTGDGSASVAVGALDSPTGHTFVGVAMSADGSAIDLTAAFSDDANCTFSESNAGTAPASCSQNVGPIIDKFVLIDANSDQAIPQYDPLVDGAVLNKNNLPNLLNIEAVTDPTTVGRVRLLPPGMKAAGLMRCLAISAVILTVEIFQSVAIP